MPNWNEVRDAVAEDFDEGGRLGKINIEDIREGDTVTIQIGSEAVTGEVYQSTFLGNGLVCEGFLLDAVKILSHIPAALLDSVREGVRLDEATYRPTLRERAWRSESNAWRVRFETAQRELAEEKAGRLTWQERAEEMDAALTAAQARTGEAEADHARAVRERNEAWATSHRQAREIERLRARLSRITDAVDGE